MKSLETRFNGRKFHRSGGKWIDSKTLLVAPTAIESQLNHEAIAVMTAEAACKTMWSKERRVQIFKMLHNTLGASLKHLARTGFFNEVQEHYPEVAIASIYEEVEISAGLSFQNCERLRDRFFQNLQHFHFEFPVRLVGHGPFANNDLRAFLVSRGVEVLEATVVPRCVVLGRNGWTKEELRKIIEQSEGGVLRVYSQEMVTAVLAGHPDPFQVFPLTQRLWDLYAFSLGHEGLECVASLWDDWYHGYRSACREYQKERRGATEKVEQSPLAVMGYSVGANGLGPTERRLVLRRAFAEPLPFVVSERYMEKWGRVETGRRLQRIATHLTRLIEAGQRRPSLDGALADWASDLRWLYDELYRSEMDFVWPRAGSCQIQKSLWAVSDA